MASRVGIIGLGTIGKAHWRVVRESPQTTLIAVADPTPSAVDFARAESIPAYTDYREMLENETLDGTVVAVPNAEHVPVALACIERGIAVLVEKPVADLVEPRARCVKQLRRVMCRCWSAIIVATILPSSVCVRPSVMDSSGGQ